jgi:hypothetical protein
MTRRRCSSPDELDTAIDDFDRMIDSIKWRR